MANIIKRLCENCAYRAEDIEGKHCKICAENTEDNFVSKEFAEEIRNKAIDDVFDFLKTQRDKKSMKVNFDDLEIRKYKEQLKGGAE